MTTKMRLGAVGVIVVGTVVWLAATGLGKNLTYFLTPSELLARGSSVIGQRLRLGGEVASGSVRRDPATGTIAFTLTDGKASIPVVNRGNPPELFREGIGAVVEGTYGRDGIFRSDSVLVKHSSDYRPPQPGQTPNGSDLSKTLDKGKAR